MFPLPGWGDNRTLRSAASDGVKLETEQTPSLPTRLLALLQRHPWFVPLFSFVFGWLSFVLVERGEALARLIAALALIGWPWLLAESFLGQWLERRTRGVLSVGAVRYLTQSLQLEILFFSLPFLIGATRLDAGHIAFTSFAAIAALVCSIDPLYTRRIAERPFASVVFQAYCNFVGALVVLPIAAQLSLEVALPLALVLSGLLIVLSLPRLLAGANALQRLLRLVLIALVPLALWLLRAEIPAAGLRLGLTLISRSVNENLEPGLPVTRISAAELHAQGLVAFTAIRAPAGLTQSVEFVWRLRGQEIDRIPASIAGGRSAGYRVYSRKYAFPADPRGPWEVDLITPQGQLICRLRFSVD